MKTVADLKTSVSGMLTGISLNTIPGGVEQVFERTARETLVQLDIPEAVARAAMNLYSGVFDYTAPSGMFASGIIDIRPQGKDRSSSNLVEKQFGDQFDREKGFVDQGVKFTVEYDNGTGTLRVVTGLTPPEVVLDAMTDTTGWTVDGAVATSLTTDQAIFWQSPSSLMFQLGSGIGTLTKTITATDLTLYKSVGMVFLAIYAPSITNLSSITLRLGSSSTKYYEVTATTGFIMPFTAGQFMLVGFDLSTAITAPGGTPTITAMNYVQLRVTTTGSITNFHMGELFISLPTPVMLAYNTPNIFLPTASSTPLSTITNSADTVLLNDAAFAIYEIKCAINVASSKGGTLASGLIATLAQTLNGVRGYRGVLIQPGLLDLYRADNPSQELRPGGTYYGGLQG